MNAFFFTAEITQSQMRPAPGHWAGTTERLETWDSCVSQIVYHADRDAAQKEFEKWIFSGPVEETPVQIDIKQIVVAPLVDQLFTERGNESIDWPQISGLADASLETANAAELEQGYWADVNQLVPADKLPASVESLRRELPEDIRSGLNWSSDRIFFFLVSVLSPLAPQRHGARERPRIDLRTGEILRADPSDLQNSEDEHSIFPQLVEKKAAALMQARNSVVAAWLWRKFTESQGLPANEIRIDPWCGAIPAAS